MIREILIASACGLFGGLCIACLVAGMIVKANVDLMLSETYGTDPQ